MSKVRKLDSILIQQKEVLTIISAAVGTVYSNNNNMQIVHKHIN